jgi:hypothetical protein
MLHMVRIEAHRKVDKSFLLDEVIFGKVQT